MEGQQYHDVSVNATGRTDPVLNSKHNLEFAFTALLGMSILMTVVSIHFAISVLLRAHTNHGDELDMSVTAPIMLGRTQNRKPRLLLECFPLASVHTKHRRVYAPYGIV